jgi:hypothetical protein
LKLDIKISIFFFSFETENRPSTDRFFRYLRSVTEKPKIGIFAITAHLKKSEVRGYEPSFFEHFLRGFQQIFRAESRNFPVTSEASHKLFSLNK